METLDLYPHVDVLAALDSSQPAQDKLRLIHTAVKRVVPAIHRMAVALHDEQTHTLRTFVSSGDVTPLARYETALANAPGLVEMLKVGRPRVVNNLDLFKSGMAQHTRWVGANYAASYTVAVRAGDALVAFLFFNADRADVFTEPVLQTLDVYAHLGGAVLREHLQTMRTLAAVVRIIHALVHERDPETGAHLDRMARYAQLIARDLADRGLYALEDEYIDQIFTFAPLHDVGKIAIPDRVLLKPAGLTDEERTLMKTHAARGKDILTQVIAHLRLQDFPAATVLRNIAAYHHEKMDGTGYPDGLPGAVIPLEARIVAVADVYDALTNARHYKPAWSPQDAAATLRRMAGNALDPQCVESLLAHPDAVAEIARSFTDGRSTPPA